MRILIFCVSLSSFLLAARAIAYAQPQAEPAQSAALSIGARLGPDVTWFGGEDANTDFVHSTSRVGFFLGAFIQYRIASFIALHPELLLIDKGTRYNISTSPSNRESRAKYLEILLLVRTTLPWSHSVNPYLIAGPEVGVLVNCEIEVEGIIGDCSDTRKPFDFGLALGVGAAVELPWPGEMLFELRYDHGLISFDGSELQQDLMNRAVLFSIGYYHHLGAPAN